MNGEKMDLVAAVRILFYQKKMDDILDYYNQHKDQIYNAPSLSKIMNIIFHSFDSDWFQLISGPFIDRTNARSGVCPV